MRMRCVLAASLALWCGAAFADDPAQVVRDFYRWEIHGKSGVTEELLRPVRPLLSDKLHAALVAVARQEAACARVTPAGMKPYIIDGDVWYYFQSDGAQELLSTAAHTTRNAALVDARLRHTDLTWTDTVLLARESGRWVIADIRFEQGGSLTAALHDYAVAAARECRTKP
jgi:hypothetical protein